MARKKFPPKKYRTKRGARKARKKGQTVRKLKGGYVLRKRK